MLVGAHLYGPSHWRQDLYRVGPTHYREPKRRKGFYGAGAHLCTGRLWRRTGPCEDHRTSHSPVTGNVPRWRTTATEAPQSDLRSTFNRCQTLAGLTVLPRDNRAELSSNSFRHISAGTGRVRYHAPPMRAAISWSPQPISPTTTMGRCRYRLLSQEIAIITSGGAASVARTTIDNGLVGGFMRKSANRPYTINRPRSSVSTRRERFPISSGQVAMAATDGLQTVGLITDIPQAPRC